MYELQPGDLSKAASVLGEAFHDYPVFEYVIPDATYRKDRLRYLCHFLLRLGMSKGEVLAPSDKIEGVSIWLPADGSTSSGIDAVKAGFLSLLFHVHAKTISRFVKVGNIKGRMRATVVKGPYYLCDMIGVSPLYQRCGFGRKMIEAKLMHCDESQIPCYLETSDPANITYYEQFGFKLIHEYQNQCVDTFCLLREQTLTGKRGK